MIRSLALILLLASGSVAGARDFTVEKLAPDVYALMRTEPASLWFNPNTVFIIGRRWVTVVDTNISSAYTREALAELRRLTRKPVRYVINTHWHDDHIIGNRVYHEAFPDVEFVAQESALADLPTIGAENRKSSVDNGPGFAAYLRKLLETGKNLEGKPITDEERLGYASDARLVESFLAESRSFEIVPPPTTLRDQMVIDDGRRRFEILFLGRAHTGGDLVVWLPKERIAASGDLVVEPVPLVGSTSYPLEYAATLERLLALQAKAIVPGHGRIQRDPGYVRKMVGLLTSIRSQTEAAFEAGITLDEFRRKIDLSRFEKEFAGDSQHRRFVFENYVTLPATAAAFRQLSGKGN